MSDDQRKLAAWEQFKNDLQYIVPKIDQGSFYRGYTVAMKHAAADAYEAKLTTKIKRFFAELFS
jgi:hypothetical protein